MTISQTGTTSTWAFSSLIKSATRAGGRWRVSRNQSIHVPTRPAFLGQMLWPCSLYNNRLHPDIPFFVRLPFSTMSLTVQAVNVALAIIVLWLLKKFTEKKPPGRPIPGPKGWPIIGNLFDVPTEKEYKVFSRWQKKYGASRIIVLKLKCNNSTTCCRRYYSIECPRTVNRCPQLPSTCLRDVQQEEFNLFKSATFYDGVRSGGMERCTGPSQIYRQIQSVSAHVPCRHRHKNKRGELPRDLRRGNPDDGSSVFGQPQGL